MISGMIIMIIIVFMIFIESMNHGRMLNKYIRGIGFRGCGNVENNRGVGRGVFGHCGAFNDGFMKIFCRSRGQSMLKKSVENNSVNCPFSGHGVQILDKTCTFSGHGVHFLDITNFLISLTLK